MTPQYIVLTVTRVATKNRNNPRTASANILNPPVRQLFILPMSILKAQHGESSEAEVGDGTLLSFAEHFEDVVEAINFASTHMRAVARPVQRQAINAAGQHVAPEPVSPLKRLADEMRDGTANFVQPSEAEKRAAEGAKHQDEPVWDDFVQTGGENV